MSESRVATERLWLTATDDVVLDGDPNAMVLLCAEGDEIPAGHSAPTRASRRKAELAAAELAAAELAAAELAAAELAAAELAAAVEQAEPVEDKQAELVEDKAVKNSATKLKD